MNTSDNLSIELSQVEVMYVATGTYNAYVAMYVAIWLHTNIKHLAI